MINFIFNLSKLIAFSFYLKKKENIINKDYELLKKYINDCGCICIKCCQWVIPLLEKEKLNPVLLNKLSDAYENNYIHDIKYTEYIYEKHFYKKLYENYKIIEVLGSGSIALVYKLQDLNTGDYYVMKVKHPNIEKQIYLFKNILKIIYKIKYFNKFFYNYFPFNLIDFVEDFNKQTDLINECNNLLTFYNYYKNNEYIIIPKLIKSSEDLIIMEYIEGTCIDSMEIREYEKGKIIYLLYLFVRNNMIILNNNHGDLHKCNWKVSNDKIKNIHKIIIYDFGYCFKNNKEEYENVLSVCNLLQTYDKNNLDKIKQYDLFLKFLFNLDNIKINLDFDRNIVKPDILLKHILDISNSNNIIINRYKILNILLLMCLIDKYIQKYNITVGPTNKIKHNLLNTYTFCEYHDIFKELSEEILIEYNGLPHATEIFETIKFSDKIKSLI